ncbi:class I SAM-dependent methyltransferase [Streptantibioticus rubrisoli]|uniref:Class I SAM-dependent methyltransferase n=1 Tax=Streptantibioticus rubrisoli TaxID=1387313 RepID=A0ABT1P7I3_9ACTN|nr:class I SAM-dependent methyltransferase [Streptantibioticus rubrisoli]MCQ4041335.1 class I SAM-dependent methyltransferase [Streptantibioticus rubrisoli]
MLRISATPPMPVRVLDPAGADYHRALTTFLASTDQGQVAVEQLAAVIRRLPHRGLFVDAGAGDGATTSRLARHFQRTVAIEPHALLREACPQAELLPGAIAAVRPDEPADLVLCSHVLYQVPRRSWAETVRRMLGWLAEEGELVVVLRNPDSDCQRLVRHFTGVHLDLTELRDELAHDGVEARIETLTSHVHTDTMADAVTVAEFLLNTAPLKELGAPDRRDLEVYLRRAFADYSGGFTLTSTQDFLHVRRAR